MQSAAGSRLHPDRVAALHLAVAVVARQRGRLEQRNSLMAVADVSRSVGGACVTSKSQYATRSSGACASHQSAIRRPYAVISSRVVGSQRADSVAASRPHT